MRTQTMTVVVALTFMMSLSAYATDISATAVPGETGTYSGAAKDSSMMDDIKSGLTKADESMRETADDISAFFIGKNPDSQFEPVMIRRKMTAHGLIGEKIINAKNEKIATVKDIILGIDGKAALVVVSDAGFLGIGNKVAAFDYNRVLEQKPDGTVVMMLSQDMVDRAADFSYDQKDWEKAKVIPVGSISVNTLLKGDVLDNNSKKVASIENVYFRRGDVSQIIVSFNKTFGMGGDLAALDYDDMQLVRKNGSLDFKLTANQSRQFKHFKKSASK